MRSYRGRKFKSRLGEEERKKGTRGTVKLPSQVVPGHSIDPVPTVPIQHTTDAVIPAPPLLGTLPSEAPRRVSTPAALPETPSPAEIEFLESERRLLTCLLDTVSRCRVEGPTPISTPPCVLVSALSFDLPHNKLFANIGALSPM